jgi:hypothetical protein
MLKPLPNACNKQRLYDAFREISRREIAEEIYKVIMNNRKVDLHAAKCVHVLRKNEVKAVMIALGELEE